MSSISIQLMVGLGVSGFFVGLIVGMEIGEPKGRKKGIREGRELAKQEQRDATWEELKPLIEEQLGKKASHL